MSSHCTPGPWTSVTRMGWGVGSGANVGSGMQEFPPGGGSDRCAPCPEGEAEPFSTGQRRGADPRPMISAGPPERRCSRTARAHLYFRFILLPRT